MTIQIPHFQHRLWLDFETRSRNDIKRGSYVYAEDSSIIMAQYALDDGEVRVWDAGNRQPMPRDLHDYFSASHLVQLAAHNTAFDRVQMAYWDWTRGYDIRSERWYCTQTAARLAGLPGGLDALCSALGMPDNYSKKDGNALIRLFCIPNRNTGRYVEPWEQPNEWAEFIEYGIRDIVSMREAMRRIPQVYTPVEQALMCYTDRMNDRGLPVDRRLAVAAMAQADAAKVDAKREATRLVAEDWEMEPNEEFNPASQKAIVELAESYGIKLADARSATLEKMLDSADAFLLPEVFRKLLALRVRTNKASTAKYKSLLQGTNSDNRARGLITFYGANRTGRDAGRRFQPQNLARPVLLGKNLSMERACQMVIEGSAVLHVDNPMQLLSDCVRGAIAAPPGKKFATADLSAIEGRVLPWLMCEEWKTQYFRDLDAGKVKYDGYQLAYSVAFGVDPSTVTKDQRTLGKPIELSTGYQGGVGALVTFATLYRIDIDKMARDARSVADPALWAECDNSYDWFLDKGLTLGLEKDTWVGCQYIVKAWRNKHPATVAGWARCEQMFRAAINTPGVRFPMAYRTTVHSEQGWVFVTLPSGRQLVYPHAHITEREGSRGGQLAFWSVNPFTKRWGLIYTYAGKLCIAAGTLVLTRQDGWVTIEKVTAVHEVWDGDAWVTTGGHIHNGNREVIEAYGAHMTADHEVLTEEGWKHASQSSGYNRAPCRLPDGVEVPRERRAEVTMGCALRLRGGDSTERQRHEKDAGGRGDCIVRVHEGRDAISEAQDARHVEAPSVCGVAQHGRSLPSTIASGVAQLWRAGHQGLRSMAQSLRELLGRHGANVPAGSDAGPRGQQPGVQPGKLPMGDLHRAGKQPAGECSVPRLDGDGASPRVGGEGVDAAVPAGPQRAMGAAGGTAGCRAEVYDLMDCGPRNRFTIWAGGAPLIVHNCENLTQAVARDVLMWSVPLAENAGYPIIMRVHDEFIAEVWDTPGYSGQVLARIMSTNHHWCDDLPLAAVGEDVYRYQK